MSSVFRWAVRSLALIVVLAGGLAVPRPAAATTTPICTPTSPCYTATDIVCWEWELCKVPITVFPATTAPVTLHYATANGTAAAPADYLPAVGTLGVPGGSSVVTVPITLPSGAHTTAGRYFYLMIFSPSQGTVVDSTGIVTIMPPAPV